WLLAVLGLLSALVPGQPPTPPPVALFLAIAAMTAVRLRRPLSFWIDGALAGLGAVLLLAVLPGLAPAPAAYWLALAACWIFAWLFVERLTAEMRAGRLGGRFFDLLVPLLFGVAILVVWETVTRGAGVPAVLLPPPSMIWGRILSSTAILAA